MRGLTPGRPPRRFFIRARIRCNPVSMYGSDYVQELLTLFFDRGGDFIRHSDKKTAMKFFIGVVEAVKAGYRRLLGVAVTVFSLFASDFNTTAACFKPIPAIADVEDIDVVEVPRDEVTAHGAEEWVVTFRCALRGVEERFDVAWRVTYFPSLDKLLVQPDYRFLIAAQHGREVKVTPSEVGFPEPAFAREQQQPRRRRRPRELPEREELRKVEEDVARELGLEGELL